LQSRRIALTGINGHAADLRHPNKMKWTTVAAMKRSARRSLRKRPVVMGAAVMIGLGGLPPEAKAEDIPGDVTSGRILAGKLCAKCHDVRSNSDISPLPDAPSFQEIADTPSTTQLSLRVFLQTPHRLMPDLRLTAEERDDAISYILSLKRKTN
jgi:cytochrome c